MKKLIDRELIVGMLGLVVLGINPLASAHASETEIAETTLGWQSIINIFRRENDDPGSGNNHGSRDPNLCLISPTREQLIWHRNPVFIWKGHATTGLRLTADPDNSLWQETVEEHKVGGYRAYISDSQLEPGQQYTWMFYTISKTNPAMEISFQIMDVDLHAEHATALAEIRQEFITEGADQEAIALASASYFLSHNLRADAVQAIFTVSNPSQTLIDTRAAIVAAICDDTTDEENGEF